VPERPRPWLPAHNGVSHGFRAHNADKRSLVLDLKSDMGRSALRRLSEGTDVLVENLKPGTLARLASRRRSCAGSTRLIY
jgi:crotonobetainyl-CoA:carnitine CoA-transferase CaiB-like acyl-CoA transferase